MATSSTPIIRYYPYYSTPETSEFSSRQGDTEDDSRSEEGVVYRAKLRPGTPVSEDEVLVPFGRARAYTDTIRRKPLLIKSDKILRITARFAFGLLPCWPRRVNPCVYTASVVIVILQILAFSEYIYCVHNFWWNNPYKNPERNHTDSIVVNVYASNTSSTAVNLTSASHAWTKIPVVTLIMEVGLFISGIISLILACRYFYSENQNFDASHCELIPQVEFGLTYEEGYVGPTPREWLITNCFLFLAMLDIFFIVLVDFRFNAYFDFYGIHWFVEYMESAGRYHELALYYAYITVYIWNLASAVVSCCVFHILTRDIIQHIRATEKNILTERVDTYIKARDLHEDLLQYREKIIEKIHIWFTTHNVLFFFILLCVIFNWFQATNGEQVEKHKVLWASQLLASLLIAFKFSFPFLSASRVTARFEEMYYVINRQKLFPDIRDLPKFLDYAERCNYGFVVFGFKITTNIALITILTTFVGIFRFLTD